MEHGLEAILAATMATYIDVPWYSEEPSSALIVAAACGETNTVRLLLNRMTHDNSIVERAISAAFTLEDGKDILELLLADLMDKLQGLDDISATFDRAVRSGQYDLVQRLCTRWAFLKSKGTLEGALLRAASIEGTLGRMKHLCEQGKSKLNTYSDWECKPC